MPVLSIFHIGKQRIKTCIFLEKCIQTGPECLEGSVKILVGWSHFNNILDLKLIFNI